MKGLAATTFLYGYRVVRDAWRSRVRNHPVRIFTYHRVMDGCVDGMTVTPRTFRQQVEYLVRTHDVVTLDEALGRLREGTAQRRPSCVITFDDAYASVFDHAYPIMEELGIPGCVFVATDFVDSGRFYPHDEDHPRRDDFSVMGWDQLRRLKAAGWCIEGHTASHRRMSECDEAEARAELVSSAETLQRQLGSAPVALAYPFGQASDIAPHVVDLLPACGYEACLSNYGGDNGRSAQLLSIRRIELGCEGRRLAWMARAHGWDASRLRTLLKPASRGSASRS